MAAFEYVVDPVGGVNSGPILNDVLHGEIASALGDFEGLDVSNNGTRYSFWKTSAWSGAHQTTLDSLLAAHTGTPPPGGEDVSYQTAAVLHDSGANEIMLAAPDPIGASYTLTLPSSVGSAAQLLKTADGNGTLQWVDESINNQIVQYDFGGKLDQGSRFIKYLGKATDSDLASGTSTQSKCSIAYEGTLVKIAYQTQLDFDNTETTTKMEIRKNGSSVVQFFCSNAITDNTVLNVGSGVEPLSVSMSAGDYIQLKQVSGRKPYESACVIYQEIQ